MRALIYLAVVALAVIVQVTVVDRIVFPGGAGPDLVLLAVAALALAGGPLAGALTGFWAGLALDVAPPGSHFVGQNALVFCLIGYACGLAADEPPKEGLPEQGHTALFEIGVTAAGAACGEILSSLLGAMLSDPRVTWPAIKHVLPVAVAYDVLLAPFVLYGVAALLRLAPTRGERDRATWPGLATQAAVPGAARGVVRQLDAGDSPRLRLADRGKGEGWVGGARGQRSGWPAAKREPRLNLSRSSLGGAALGAAYAAPGTRRGSGALGGPARLKGLKGSTSLRAPSGQGGALTGGLSGAPAKVRFGARPRAGVLGGSLLGGSVSGSAALRSSRFGRSRMGRSLLGGSVFSRSPSALNRPAPVSRSAPLGRSSLLGRSSFLGRRSWLGGPPSMAGSGRPMRPVPGRAAGRAPRFSKGSPLARLTAALRRPARASRALQKSPGRGWLRRTSSRSGATGQGALGRRTMGRGAFSRGASGRTALGRGYSGGRTSRLHMPRPKNPRAKRKRRTGGYR